MARFLGLQSADQPGDFIRALKKLQSDCGVSDLKMYGINSDEFEKFVKNARGCMGSKLLDSLPTKLLQELKKKLKTKKLTKKNL